MRAKVFEKAFLEELYRALEVEDIWNDRDRELIVHGYKMGLLSVLCGLAGSTDSKTYEKYRALYDSIDWSKRKS